VVYDLLRDTKTREILSYEKMAQALGLDPVRDRQILRSAMHRAAREHEAVDKRAVEAITNEGYRVVEPEAHLDLAHRHQIRARGQLDRGRSKVENVDLNQLDPPMRTLFLNVVEAFAIQQDQIRRLDIKNQHLEEAIQSVDRKAARTDADIAGLAERLRWLEDHVGKPPHQDTSDD
jgi:hypothetical protein